MILLNKSLTPHEVGLLYQQQHWMRPFKKIKRLVRVRNREEKSQPLSTPPPLLKITYNR